MTELESDVDVEMSAADVAHVAVAITRTLRVADGRLEPTLDAVVASASRVTGHDAGLALVEDGTLTPAATTARAPHELDVVQADLGAGPCLDAATTQSVIRVEDTASERRWPPFGERAAAMGVAAMICVPLWVDDRLLGTLSLYSGRRSAFADPDLLMAEMCAALAAAAIADARRGEQLRDAMGRRDLIGQAKGILMERHRVTADQAFELLAHSSQSLNRKLVAVAQRLVETGELPGSR